MMKNKKKNVLEWANKHKVEIGLGALTVVATIGGVILFKRFTDSGKIMERVKDTCQTFSTGIGSKHLDIHDIGVGELTDAITYPNGTFELWMDNVPLKDIGELGESLQDQFSSIGITEDSKIWMLMSVYPNET